MANNSIGFIETYGLAACIAAADAAVKSANVKLIGYEYAKGDGLCTVKVEGNVGACKAAIISGKRAADSVRGTHQGTKSTLLKARPADGIMDTMVKHRENVGGDEALAEGYRPKGESRMPVLVKNWKPKEEAVPEAPVEVEEPISEAPVTSEVEDLKEEAEDEESDSEKERSLEEEIPDEAPDTEEAVMEEAPETVEETPVAEEVSEAVEETPVVEEVPEAVEETPVVEEVPEAVEETPVVEKAPEVTEEPAPAKKPGKSTSGGSRKRSRRRKTDK